MQTEIHSSLSDIPRKEWNRLNSDNNPFTSYAFIRALEESGCIGNATGWLPRYLLIRDKNNKLCGLLPMFEKHHSWGEYVFDWAWANAWQQCGLEYYPKLIIAVPFSPVTGQRFLTADDQNRTTNVDALLQTAIEFAKEESYSSLHILFPAEQEVKQLADRHLLIRQDVQFHWQNNSYLDFDDFLSSLNSRKRKKIARERRRVAETGVTFHLLSGDKILPSSMKNMYQFYLSTVMLHGSQSYLNEEFFLLLGDTMANDLVLIEAHFEGEIIAAALNVRHDKTLYGRYWGCKQAFNSLHFETCYYQAIDYCIDQGMHCFEGGAQGEHKLSRGFLPIITSSAHWMADARLSQAVDEFLTKEKEHVTHYQKLLNDRSPFTICDEKD